MALPSTLEENLSHYYHWKKNFNGESFFYDYPLGRAHYGDFGYMKISKTIYEDIRALKALGSDGYMSCQQLRTMLPSGFPNFVMGQVLCDETISYEALKATYFQTLLGKEYHISVRYLETLSMLSDMDYFNGKGPRVQPMKAAAFEQIAAKAEQFLCDAPVLQRTAECTCKENWSRLIYHASYSIPLSSALAKLCRGEQADADLLFKEFCTMIQSNELQHQPFLDVYRFIGVSTKYTGFTLP